MLGLQGSAFSNGRAGGQIVQFQNQNFLALNGVAGPTVLVQIKSQLPEAKISPNVFGIAA